MHGIFAAMMSRGSVFCISVNFFDISKPMLWIKISRVGTSFFEGFHNKIFVKFGIVKMRLLWF